MFVKTIKIKKKKDLYPNWDILLLADVFENFHKTCLQCYKLDPAHYFTNPGLSLDAMLKMTGIKLKLMSDVDQFQFIEKGMCSGISYIANRYGGANTKYMSNHNPEEASSISCIWMTIICIVRHGWFPMVDTKTNS